MAIRKTTNAIRKTTKGALRGAKKAYTKSTKYVTNTFDNFLMSPVTKKTQKLAGRAPFFRRPLRSIVSLPRNLTKLGAKIIVTNVPRLAGGVPGLAGGVIGRTLTDPIRAIAYVPNKRKTKRR